jgi:chromosome segregation ATPase
LKDLLDKKKISPEVFQDMHNSFTNVLSSLKKDAQEIVEDATVEIERCREEITSLSYAIANLEIEHEIGKVDEENYKSAFVALQDALRRATSERTDYELTKSKISSVLLGDNQDALQRSKTYAEQVNVAAQKLPEPPVVVYVKEVGKAGI